MTEGYGHVSHPTRQLIQACKMLEDRDARIMELEAELRESNKLIFRLYISLVIAVILIGMLIFCVCVG